MSAPNQSQCGESEWCRAGTRRQGRQPGSSGAGAGRTDPEAVGGSPGSLGGGRTFTTNTRLSSEWAWAETHASKTSGLAPYTNAGHSGRCGSSVQGETAGGADTDTACG